MSVQFDPSRNRWVVRWYEAGRQRSRRFALEGPARFDAERHELKAAARDATAARLAGELARLRARAGTIEHQLPADARDTGVYSYASSTTSAWPRSTATSTHRSAAMTGRVLEFDSDADDVGQVDAVRKPNGWATPVPSL